MSFRVQSRGRKGEQGFALLYLLMLMAVLAIAAGIITSDLKFDIKRDREEEMIHRGVQYSRAIRAYYKKFGRYPTKIEDLESTNNLRFLRKRYKDPLSCKNGQCADFKLLHFGEVQMMSMGAVGGVPNLNGNQPGGGLNSAQPNGPGSFTAMPNAGLNQGQSQAGAAGSEPQDASQAVSADGATDVNGNPQATVTGTTGTNQLGSGQVIGGAIVGVASTSKEKTIREYNHKTKYKDWAFVYDPAQDTGRLITGPYQPQMPSFGQQGMPNLNGQNGNNGNSGFGNNNGFGNSNGFGNNNGAGSNGSNSPSMGGFGTSGSSNSSSGSSQQQQ